MMDAMIKRLKRIFYGVVILVVLYLLRPHGPNFTEMGRERDLVLAQQQQNLVVGVSWPVSLRGADLVNGMKVAVAHIKETGLMGDMPIELVVRDDEAQITTAQDIASEFAATANMSAVIGYGDNRQAAAAAVIYQSAKLLQIVVGAPSTELTHRDQPYLVRTTPSARKVARQLAATTGKEPIKFAVITEKTGYQEEFAEAFSIAQMHKGGTRIFNRAYPTEIQPDFVRSSYEIRDHKADVILFAGQAKQAANFAKQAQRIGLTTPIMCSCTDFKTLQREAGTAAQGIILPGFYQPTTQTPQNKRFVGAYQARFGTVPNEWAAQGFDAMLTLAHAVAQSGSIKPLDLAWSIRYMAPVPGVSGHFDFTPNGDLMDKPVYGHAISVLGEADSESVAQ